MEDENKKRKRGTGPPPEEGRYKGEEDVVSILHSPPDETNQGGLSAAHDMYDASSRKPRETPHEVMHPHPLSAGDLDSDPG
jgi:hypothetical protein